MQTIAGLGGDGSALFSPAFDAFIDPFIKLLNIWKGISFKENTDVNELRLRSKS